MTETEINLLVAEIAVMFRTFGGDRDPGNYWTWNCLWTKTKCLTNNNNLELGTPLVRERSKVQSFPAAPENPIFTWLLDTPRFRSRRFDAQQSVNTTLGVVENPWNLFASVLGEHIHD